MNILLLAPHPFYQERGTPIAVDLLLRALSRGGDRVDVVTFHEGEDKSYPGVAIHRIARLAWVRNVRPGFSWKKVVCDFFVAIKALRLAGRNKYDVVHAVEEGVFMAMLIRAVHRIPYVFDMDSSMPMQLVEKTPALGALAPVFRFFEARAARGSVAVVAVCDALAEIARRAGAERVFVLRDISLLSPDYAPAPAGVSAPLDVQRPCLMYIGNLEPYQGIDLLLESFALALKSMPEMFLAVIGGNERAIRRYRAKCDSLGIEPRVKFFGPRPPAEMRSLFAQADILVSPRIKGINTPMKIYSYMQSGKPILATDLPTHTQALDSSIALLAGPSPDKFAAGILSLLQNPGLSRRMAENAQKLAGEKHSFKAYAEQIEAIYAEVEPAIASGR